MSSRGTEEGADGDAAASLDEGAVMRFHHFHVGVGDTFAGSWAGRRTESIHDDAERVRSSANWVKIDVGDKT